MKLFYAVLVVASLVLGGTSWAAWTGKVLSATKGRGVIALVLEVRKHDGTLYLGKYRFGLKIKEVVDKARAENLTRRQALDALIRAQIAVLEEQETSKEAAPAYTVPGTLVGSTVAN